MDTFRAVAREETLLGKIVLSVTDITTYDGATDPQKANQSLKSFLDELHLRKIDLCDEVLVLNVGGYIGDSTRREVAYAKSLGKRVRYWEHNIPVWKRTLNKARRFLE